MKSAGVPDNLCPISFLSMVRGIRDFKLMPQHQFCFWCHPQMGNPQTGFCSACEPQDIGSVLTPLPKMQRQLGEKILGRLKSVRATTETVQGGIFSISVNFPFLLALAVTTSAPVVLRDHLPLFCYSHLPSASFPTCLIFFSLVPDLLTYSFSIFSPFPFPV